MNHPTKIKTLNGQPRLSYNGILSILLPNYHQRGAGEVTNHNSLVQAMLGNPPPPLFSTLQNLLIEMMKTSAIVVGASTSQQLSKNTHKPNWFGGLLSPPCLTFLVFSIKGILDSFHTSKLCPCLRCSKTKHIRIRI